MALAAETPHVSAVKAQESSVSAVAWSAIIGGAFVAAAVSVLLLALGSGIGLASIDPWARSNPSPLTFTVGAAVWLIIVQWISSGLGGYLTGRLDKALAFPTGFPGSEDHPGARSTFEGNRQSAIEGASPR